MLNKFNGKAKIIIIIILVITFIAIGILVNNIESKKAFTNDMKELTVAFDNNSINTIFNISKKYKEDKRFLKVKDSIFINYCDKYAILYEDEKVETEDYINVLELAVQLEVHEKYTHILKNIKDKRYDLENIEKSKNNYLKGIELFNNQKYQDAISYLEQVIKEDSNYNDALEKIQLSEVKVKEQAIIAEKEKEEKEVEERKKKEEQKYNDAYKKVHDDIVNSFKNQGESASVEVYENGPYIVNGIEYYSFTTSINNLGSDVLHLIHKDSLEHFVYFLSGDFMEYSKYSAESNVKQVSIGELNKSLNKYMSKTVEVYGEIILIKESVGNSDLVLMNDQGECIHVNYVYSTSFLKGDFVTVKGVVVGETEQFGILGVPMTMPSIAIGEVY